MKTGSLLLFLEAIERSNENVLDEDGEIRWSETSQFGRLLVLPCAERRRMDFSWGGGAWGKLLGLLGLSVLSAPSVWGGWVTVTNVALVLQKRGRVCKCMRTPT